MSLRQLPFQASYVTNLAPPKSMSARKRANNLVIRSVLRTGVSVFDESLNGAGLRGTEYATYSGVRICRCRVPPVSPVVTPTMDGAVLVSVCGRGKSIRGTYDKLRSSVSIADRPPYCVELCSPCPSLRFGCSFGLSLCFIPNQNNPFIT